MSAQVDPARRSVLQVCDFASDKPGNFVPSQRAVARQARSELGLETAFVFPVLDQRNIFADDLRGEGFEVTLIDRALPPHVRARIFRSMADELGAVLVHSHFTGFDLAALWAAKRTGAKTIWHLHSGSYGSGAVKFARDLVKARGLGRLCDRIVACAEWLGDQAVERGFPADRVRTVENAIDLDRFAATHMPSRDSARSRFGLPPERPIALAFGWDPHRKGVDLMLDAMAMLPTEAANPRTRPVLALVGTEALHEYAGKRLGAELPEWLLLLDPVEDVPALLAAVDVFINASRFEGLSYAIGEAMAAGLPVVASDIPGSRAYLPAPGLEAFRDGHAADLARALGIVVVDGDRAERGKGNAEFVQNYFALGRYAREMLDVYRELIPPR